MIEENKKRDYSNNQTLPLKEIYGLVSETILLAKCKMISKPLMPFNLIKSLR